MKHKGVIIANFGIWFFERKETSHIPKSKEVITIILGKIYSELGGPLLPPLGLACLRDTYRAEINKPISTVAISATDQCVNRNKNHCTPATVSYTHLTLPTILLV